MLAPSTVYSKANWLKYFLERHMAINKIGNGDFAVGQMTSYSSLRTVLLLGFMSHSNVSLFLLSQFEFSFCQKS